MKPAVLLSVTTFITIAVAQFTPIPGGLKGTTFTSTYWDCCKPACGWTGSVTESSPVRSCAIDGVTTVEPNTVMNACEVVGEAFMCNDQQPFLINSTLAYGFTAASFSGGVDVAKCCTCFLLHFFGYVGYESKYMVVQITNTGGDLVQNQFDISTPGGGIGIFNLGCMKQWDAPTDGWGNRYGGVTSEEECLELPEVLQPGCKWRFQFLTGVSVTSVDFVQVECPKELGEISGCQ